MADRPTSRRTARRSSFSYLGDIWAVESVGGVARPITMHEAHDSAPVFAPDGRTIAFASNRFGSYDVFVVSSRGGKPKRLTFDSAQDVPVSFSADGKRVIFNSSRGVEYPSVPGLYSVSVEGGAVKELPYLEAKDIAVAPAGNRVAFTRGPGSWYRKGYRGSSNDDLFLANADGSDVSRLTEFEGQDSSPMFSPDGNSLFFVSEQFDTPANIVVKKLGSPEPAKQLTRHADDGVRKARISGNGEWIVYECGGDLWVTPTREGLGQPRKLAIEVYADDKSNPDRAETFTKGASEYALSPDESHAVVAVHGELFLTPLRGGKTKRLTETPIVEHSANFSPDGKRLVFVADKDGFDNVFVLESDDPEHAELIKAVKFKTRQLTTTPEADSACSFTPDGEKIAFLRKGRLWTMKPDGSEQKILVDSPTVFDYDFAPDAKWLAYARVDGSFASEIYVAPVDASAPPVNVTKYATYNGDVTWSKTNDRLGFISNRRDSQKYCVLDLKRPAADAKEDKDDALAPFDFDDIHLRVKRPANTGAQSGTLSRNGKLIAFRGQDSEDDLWLSSADGSALTRLTTGLMRPRQIRFTKAGSTIYFLDGSGQLRSSSTLSLSSAPSTASTIKFSAKMEVKRDEEYAEMFDQAWRNLSDNFYDPGYHGANWTEIRAKYRPLVKHCAMKEDLYSLLSLMLGELNASHLGVQGSGRTPDEETADLGLIFDANYVGPGLKIKGVLKRGPADKRGLPLNVGDVIVSIDGTPLTPKINVSELLNGKAGETVELRLSPNPADPKLPKTKVEITAFKRSQATPLYYQRWVRENAERVAKLSGGTVGYVHIPSMDESGLEQFVRSLYSENFDKEALVIDVRYNGGGFTHDQVLAYLGAKSHTFFRQREGLEGQVMRNFDRKWTKPVCVVTNNRSYSDAEIFPAAFRESGLGKLVGQTTGGMVIGTLGTRLIDGSTFRLPRIGVYTAKGVNMEKEGVRPDFPVAAPPEEVANGVDAQLRKAVEVVRGEVDAQALAVPREILPIPGLKRVGGPSVAPTSGSAK